MDAAVMTQRFDGNAGADLVSELEAVGDRFCRAEDAHRHPIDVVGFNLVAERGTREVDEAQWRMVASRAPRLPVDGELDLERIYRRQTVKSQRREQTDDAARHDSGRRRKVVPLAERCARTTIEAMAEPLEEALFPQPSDLSPRDPGALQVSGSSDPDVLKHPRGYFRRGPPSRQHHDVTNGRPGPNRSGVQGGADTLGTGEVSQFPPKERCCHLRRGWGPSRSDHEQNDLARMHECAYTMSRGL